MEIAFKFDVNHNLIKMTNSVVCVVSLWTLYELLTHTNVATYDPEMQSIIKKLRSVVLPVCNDEERSSTYADYVIPDSEYEVLDILGDGEEDPEERVSCSNKHKPPKDMRR